MKKLSHVFLLTACITLLNCSPEENQTTENSEATKAVTTETQTETVEIESEPITTPSPAPTKEEIKAVFSSVSSLKTEFEKAIKEKNQDLFHKAEEKWKVEEKKISALMEKYGAESFYNSPAGDCRQAFYHMFQAYVVFWGGATNPADDREKTAYEEDRDKLSKLFNECKISSETGKSSTERNSEKIPE